MFLPNLFRFDAFSGPGPAQAVAKIQRHLDGRDTWQFEAGTPLSLDWGNRKGIVSTVSTKHHCTKEAVSIWKPCISRHKKPRSLHHNQLHLPISLHNQNTGLSENIVPPTRLIIMYHNKKTHFGAAPISGQTWLSAISSSSNHQASCSPCHSRLLPWPKFWQSLSCHGPRRSTVEMSLAHPPSSAGTTWDHRLNERHKDTFRKIRHRNEQFPIYYWCSRVEITGGLQNWTHVDVPPWHCLLISALFWVLPTKPESLLLQGLSCNPNKDPNGKFCWSCSSFWMSLPFSNTYIFPQYSHIFGPFPLLVSTGFK